MKCLSITLLTFLVGDLCYVFAMHVVRFMKNCITNASFFIKLFQGCIINSLIDGKIGDVSTHDTSLTYGYGPKVAQFHVQFKID